MTAAQRLTVIDYDTLIAAALARIEQLQISYDLIDELAGWAPGYAGKVLGPSRVKRLGLDNLWKLLETLAVQFVVEDDPDGLRAMEGRWEKRNDKVRRAGNTAMPLGSKTIARFAREMGRKGGASRKRFRLSEKERSRINRENVKKRKWRPVRSARRRRPTRSVGTSATITPRSAARSRPRQVAESAVAKAPAPRRSASRIESTLAF